MQSTEGLRTLSTAVGKSKEFELSIVNAGSAGITDFDYTVTTDGTVGAEKARKAC